MFGTPLGPGAKKDGCFRRLISAPRSEHFSESKPQGKLNFEEQIMSKTNIPSIFGFAISTIVATPTLGNSIRIFSRFSWGIFGHMTHITWTKRVRATTSGSGCSKAG